MKILALYYEKLHENIEGLNRNSRKSTIVVGTDTKHNQSKDCVSTKFVKAKKRERKKERNGEKAR